jgi:flavin reductase (DIM6/NTAB) family NADH-FMN oxidoreductase RutF
MKLIQPTEIPDNVFKLIGDDWMLITAGAQDSFNTMTASWGFMGVLWHKTVAVCFIRPQRYTFAFADESGGYSLSFFTEQYRKALQFCGANSGRDCDKIEETGLTPFTTQAGNIAFEEARLVIDCRKIYSDDLKESAFIVPELVSKNYPARDFHRFFIGEIVGVYLND